MNEQEKSIIAANTVQSFVQQFGETDEFLTILLEILIEESFKNTQSICESDPELDIEIEKENL